MVHDVRGYKSLIPNEEDYNQIIEDKCKMISSKTHYIKVYIYLFIYKKLYRLYMSVVGRIG